MSGHSKWATIHRKKEAADNKRGAIFTKMANLITVAAKEGGDPEFNFKLRMAIDQAKSVGTPKDNIERAIKRGTGELGGNQIEEGVYEGFGPAGVAVIIETASDNKNRTVSDIGATMNKKGGKIGGANSVSWQFDHVGQMVMLKSDNQLTAAEVEEIILESGALDFDEDDQSWYVYCAIEDFQKVKEALSAKLKVSQSQLVYRPKETVDLSEDNGQKLSVLLEALDDLSDVTNIYTNAA